MSAKHNGIQFSPPSKVFVVVYHDHDYEYVGMDVFDSFDAALEQFDERLHATQDDHSGDLNWIENQVRNVEQQELYFRDKAGYEIFLSCETVQSKACHELKCHYCGRWHKRPEIGKDIFICSNTRCNRPFCAECFCSMCGGAAEETASNTVLCPQCLLESAVRCHIRETLPDYFNRMPKSFYQDILMDVQETSGYNCDGGLNDDDIRLAFARVVAKVFGVEVWRSLEENAMKNGKNHFGWELSLDCICDTLLTKRSGALKEAVGLTKLLYDLNIRALRETQLSPHCEDKRAGRYLAMLKQKRAAPDIVIIVRGGMIDEIRSTNPFTQMWIADYDRNCSGDGTDELEVAEERGNSSDMHILYP